MSFVQISRQLILIKTLWSRYCYHLHFIDEETEDHRDLPTFPETQLVSDERWDLSPNLSESKSFSLNYHLHCLRSSYDQQHHLTSSLSDSFSILLAIETALQITKYSMLDLKTARSLNIKIWKFGTKFLVRSGWPLCSKSL